MGYTDKQLDQVQQMLAAGNVQGAHQLVKGIAMDEPQNERAQALLAEATQRLNAAPAPRVSPFTPISAPAPQKKRASPLAFVLVTLIFLGFGWMFFANAGSTTRTPTTGRSSSSFSPSTVNVTLSVTTEENGFVDLTYTNATGGIEQKKADTPWTQTITVKPGTFVSVSAQATRAMTVNCRITSGGSVIQEATSRGEYVIASCSGSAR